MGTIFARIRVRDFGLWRQAFDDAEPTRKAQGISVRAIYQDAIYFDGLIVVLDAVDIEAAQAFYNSDGQRQRMARSGLESPAEMWFAGDLKDLSKDLIPR